MAAGAAADFQLELRGFVHSWLESEHRLISSVEIIGNMEIIKMELMIEALEVPDAKQDGLEEEGEKCP